MPDQPDPPTPADREAGYLALLRAVLEEVPGADRVTAEGLTLVSWAGPTAAPIFDLTVRMPDVGDSNQLRGRIKEAASGLPGIRLQVQFVPRYAPCALDQLKAALAQRADEHPQLEHLLDDTIADQQTFTLARQAYLRSAEAALQVALQVFRPAELVAAIRADVPADWWVSNSDSVVAFLITELELDTIENSFYHNARRTPTKLEALQMVERFYARHENDGYDPSGMDEFAPYPRRITVMQAHRLEDCQDRARCWYTPHQRGERE